MLEENVLAMAHMCACFQALSILNGIQLVSWFSPAFPTQKEEFVQDAKLWLVDMAFTMILKTMSHCFLASYQSHIF